MYNFDPSQESDYSLNARSVDIIDVHKNRNKKKNKSVEKNYCLPQINLGSKLFRQRQLNQGKIKINYKILYQVKLFLLSFLKNCLFLLKIITSFKIFHFKT